MLFRSRGHNLTTYIDDCFVTIDPTILEIDNGVPRTPFLLLLLKVAFGMFVNLEKSDLSINHEKEFLGMNINSMTQMVSIPDKKWFKFRLQCLKAINQQKIPFKEMERIRGKAISFLIVVPRAKLMIRRMTEVLQRNQLRETDIIMDARIIEELRFWIDLSPEQRIAPWFSTKIKKDPILVCTDASMNGLGFVILQRSLKNKTGFKITEDVEYLTEDWQGKNIAVKEAQAILRLLQRYPTILSNKQIIECCDNMNVYHMFQNDGSRQPYLNDVFRGISSRQNCDYLLVTSFN